jgi:hypothetical protein
MPSTSRGSPQREPRSELESKLQAVTDALVSLGCTVIDWEMEKLPDSVLEARLTYERDRLERLLRVLGER